MMKVTSTAIADVKIFEPAVHTDDRGFFLETWRKSIMEDNGITLPFVQDNQSYSTQGTLRGLHYQLEKPQGKLVRAISGEIYDVAVDIRKSSPTFGKWVGQILSSENKKQLWVPPGFAHGFLVTSSTAEIAYKCTDYYNHGDEYCLMWNDPQLAITWPELASEPLLSDKDKLGKTLQQASHFE